MFIVRTNKGILHSQHTPLFVHVFQSVIIVFVVFELEIIRSSLCHAIKYNNDNVYAVNFKYNRIQTETIFSLYLPITQYISLFVIIFLFGQSVQEVFSLFNLPFVKTTAFFLNKQWVECKELCFTASIVNEKNVDFAIAKISQLIQCIPWYVLISPMDHMANFMFQREHLLPWISQSREFCGSCRNTNKFYSAKHAW